MCQHERFMAIMKALASTETTRNQGHKNKDWQPPFSANASLVQAVKLVREQCASVFKSRWNILSIDDDVIRLRSHKVKMATGFTQINNPKKGYAN